MKKVVRPSAAANWCFTINDFLSTHTEYLHEHYMEWADYVVFGEEIAPTTGMPHLQGYVQFKKRQRLTAIKKIICFDKAHLEIAKGTPEENYKYCTKAGMWRELGAMVRPRSLDKMRNLVNACETWSDVLDIEGVSRHLNYARECFCHKKPKTWDDFVCRPWQQRILDELEKPADSRTILWVYDQVGNAGKSYFGQYLYRNHGAFYTQPAKQADIFFLYDNQKIFIYDIPRSYDEEIINYGTLEKIKDGIYTSGKYTPVTKCRDGNAHVVVFSNRMPDDDKFSADRLKIIDLSIPPTIVEVIQQAIAEPAQAGDNAATALPLTRAPSEVEPAPKTMEPIDIAKKNTKRRKRIMLKLDYSPDVSSDDLDPQNTAVSDSITRNCGTMAPLGT